MFSILHTLAVFVADIVKSRSRLEAEDLLLRHQLNFALRKAPAVCDCAAVIEQYWFGWFGSGMIDPLDAFLSPGFRRWVTATGRSLGDCHRKMA